MKRLEDYEAMKGLTILIVVFAHVTRMFAPQGVIPITYSPVLEVVTNFIYIFHMPAFVAVTGAVYYFIKREKGKYNNPKTFIINKINRLIVPFIFFSFAVVLPTLWYLGLRDSVLEFTIKEVALGASRTHLWYSAMIFVVFVLFNFFEKHIYSNKEWVNWGMLFICNIFSFIIPNAFQVTNMLTYLVFFYAGYWFQKNRKEVYPVLKNKFIQTFVISIVVYLILFHSPVRDMFLLKKVFQLIGGLSGTALLYVTSDKLSGSKIYMHSLFQEIIGSSYGIYLFHPMLVYLISYWVQDIDINAYLLASLNFMVVLFLSILFVKVMRKLSLQVLIGENSPNRMPVKVVDNS